MMVDLDKNERRIMTDILDLWVLGIPEAKELTTEDPTIETAEELLELAAGYDDDLALLASIRSKLNPKEDSDG